MEFSIYLKGSCGPGWPISKKDFPRKKKLSRTTSGNIHFNLMYKYLERHVAALICK